MAVFLWAIKMPEKYPVIKLEYDKDAEDSLRKEIYPPSFAYRDPLLIEKIDGGYHTKPINRARWYWEDRDPNTVSAPMTEAWQ